MDEAERARLYRAFEAGWEASGEGYNGEIYEGDATPDLTEYFDRWLKEEAPSPATR